MGGRTGAEPRSGPVLPTHRPGQRQSVSLKETQVLDVLLRVLTVGCRFVVTSLRNFPETLSLPHCTSLPPLCAEHAYLRVKCPEKALRRRTFFV